jgi:hypothetical protein
MEIWINPPRLAEDGYQLTDDLLHASSGPLAYDWDNYRPVTPSRPGDPQTEAVYYSFGNHAAPIDIEDDGSMKVIEGGYDFRVLAGGSMDNTYGGFWSVEGTHVVIATRPKGSPSTPPRIERPRPKEVDAFYSQFTGCRYLNWTLPMLHEEAPIELLLEGVELPGKAWAPIHLERCEQVAKDGVFFECDVVEIHNELPWNTSPADWHEQRALFDRATEIFDFPWGLDWGAWSDFAKDEFNKVKRDLAARMGRVAQALVANGQKEVVIGGQTTEDSQYTISIAAQQFMDVTDPKGIRYALGGYVGHGPNLKALYQDTTKEYDAEAFLTAAIKDIELMAHTWEAVRLWLDQRFSAYSIPLDLYEAGIHPPGAGGGVVNSRALEFLQKAQDDGTLEAVINALLATAEAKGIERVALFEGPRPPKVNDADEFGLRFFPLQDTHALDTPRMKTLAPYLKGSASNQLQQMADAVVEQESFEEFFRLVGVRYPMLDDLLSAGADIVQAKAPNYAAELIPWLRKMVELMRQTPNQDQQ